MTDTRQGKQEAGDHPPPPVPTGDPAPATTDGTAEPADTRSSPFPERWLATLLIQLRAGRFRRAFSVAGWVLFLAVAVAIVIVPAVVAYQRAADDEPLYEAQADVLYNIERAAFGEADKIMANAKILAERREFSTLIAEEFNIDVEEIVDNRSVDRIVVDDTSTTILRLRVRDTDPEKAQLYLERWMTDFLESTQVSDPDADLREDIEDTIATLQRRRIRAQQAIEDAEQARAETSLDGLSTTRRAVIDDELVRTITAAGSRYDEVVADINAQARLLERLEPEGIQIEIEPLSEAHADSEPVSPRPERNAALGLAIGFVMAAALLFIVLQLRSRA